MSRPFLCVLLLGVFKSCLGGTLHPVTPVPIKALADLCFFPPVAEKSKPPALRVAGDSGFNSLSAL
jgi:hypothetical protein